jgi:hypothetical protein
MEGKVFFSEEKKQKTFVPALGGGLTLLLDTGFWCG